MSEEFLVFKREDCLKQYKYPIGSLTIINYQLVQVLK